MNGERPKLIVLFTDFGPAGPYLGQMEAVLRQRAPSATIINLISDAPVANPRSSAYLLAALRASFPAQTIFLAVVDPGVGGARMPVVVRADDQIFVGPENTLFNTVVRQSTDSDWRQIIWQPEIVSNTFHGRDLFAPIAADLVNGSADAKLQVVKSPESLVHWPADLSEIVYIDHYGNAMTGLRFRPEMTARQLVCNQAESFSAVNKQQAFWCRNSSNLVEIAVNQGRAQETLDLTIGLAVRFIEPVS